MLGHEPRVGVGMPVYNGADFIASAIESILDQTFEDFELLICDNASVDDTEEICRTYERKDERVRYVRNRWNIGGGPNANRVMELSRGEFFKLMNHDDVCHPRLLEQCVKTLEERPDAVGAFPMTIDIDENAHPVREFAPRPDFASPDPIIRCWEGLRSGEEPMAHFSVLRADVLAKTGLMPSVPSADRVLMAELAMHGPLVEVPEQLFFHREHPGRAVHAAGRGHRSMAWWDPSKMGTFTFPYWRMLRSLAEAINRSPLDLRDRMRARGLLLRFARTNKHELKLIYDLAIPARALIARYYTGDDLVAKA
jgi:glycosyltransferase involved in cell wall biosynthesis